MYPMTIPGFVIRSNFGRYSTCINSCRLEWFLSAELGMGHIHKKHLEQSFPAVMGSLQFNDNTCEEGLTILLVCKLKTDEYNHTTQAQSFITYLSLRSNISPHTHTCGLTNWYLCGNVKFNIKLPPSAALSLPVFCLLKGLKLDHSDRPQNPQKM